MARFVLIMLVFVLLPRAGWAAAEAIDFGRYHALVVGINDYEHLPRLATAVNDASAVHDLLRREYGFASTLLLNPTRYELMRALDRLRAALTPRDNLVIYYAGHGSLDEKTDDGYWLPADAETDSQANWIPVHTITRTVKAMTAKHVLVVSDSCYSGTLAREAPVLLATGSERAAELRRISSRRARKALTSGVLEPVAGGGGDGHSVFARAFLEVLRNNREVLDGHRLYTGLRRAVVVAAPQTPKYSDIRFAGDDGGDFLFVPVSLGLPASAEQAPSAPVAPAAPAGVDPKMLELAFWQAIEDSEDPDDFQAYIDQFPDGTFARLAHNRLKALVPPQQAALPAVPRSIAPEPAAEPAVGVSPERHEPGDIFTDCPDCPELVVIPAGAFAMGSARGDDDEKPVHEVSIPAPFALGKYEVTKAQYAVFVRATGRRQDDGCWLLDGNDWVEDASISWRDLGFQQSDGDPVVCVSWHDAQDYVAWLSERTGRDYRLPSEAEWEYGARAGTTTLFWWGENIDPGKAVCNGCRTRWDNRGTAPAGSLDANPFGLHDTAGNVWEWVEDCWNAGYDGAPGRGQAWEGGDCAGRVLRGGSWADRPRTVRPAYRDGYEPGRRDIYDGFRVARTL